MQFKTTFNDDITTKAGKIRKIILLPLAKEEVNAFARVRLFVCLSICQQDYSKTRAWIWMKCCVSTDVGHGRTDYLLSPIRIIVRMPEPDCFLRYRLRCNAEFYYVGKIPRTGIGRPLLQRGVVIKWFYSLRAVGTTLSEVHAFHRVPF